MKNCGNSGLIVSELVVGSGEQDNDFYFKFDIVLLYLLCILGFGIELMTEIARYLQFNVTFKLVDDGKYGSINEHGRWNGMIKEVKTVSKFSCMFLNPNIFFQF